jgi:hypothetical protein
MLSLHVTLDGDEKTLYDLHGMVVRLATVEAAAPEIFEYLEHTEEKLFDWWDGKYVDTGRTRDSLTQLHGDAIRSVHPGSMEFGTSVPYAPFLRNEKGNAVLISLKPHNVAAIHAILHEHVMAGVGIRGLLGSALGAVGRVFRR